MFACSSDPDPHPAPPPTIGDAGATGEGGGGDGPNGQAGAGATDAVGGGVVGGNGSSDAGAMNGEAGSAPVAGMAGSGGSGSPPASCGEGAPTCGANLSDCCASIAVPGDTFYRSYDGVSPDYLSKAYPASVSGFKLDQFEVTVGRFRAFLAAVTDTGWRPEASSGKHTHLNAEQGLLNKADDSFEAGWDSAWDAQLDGDVEEWNARLICNTESASWTPEAGSREQWPITCVNWFEAYAFCIWDGGFLPSETEWNAAASAGKQQRAFPWSNPPTSLVIDCDYANYYGRDDGQDYCGAPGTGSVSRVGALLAGNSLWGHADLAGNVFEWTLDSFADYVTDCPDCFYSADLPYRVMRGGGFGNEAAAVLSSARTANAPDARSTNIGMRCAKGP